MATKAKGRLNPGRKVGAGALAGALSVVLVWAVGAFSSVVVPPEIASAVTVILTFAVGLFVSDA